MTRFWLRRTQTVRKLCVGLAAGMTGIMLVLYWVAPPFLLRLEDTSLDVRFKLRGERRAGNEIVLVVVDEQSLMEIGRWPWPRDKQAQLVEAIGADGAKVIGLDIIYAEPEVNEATRVLQEVIPVAQTDGAASPVFREFLRQKLAAVDADRELVKSLQAARTVVLGLPFVVPETEAAEREITGADHSPEYVKRSEFMMVRESQSGAALEPLLATVMIPPLKALAVEAAGLGHVYAIPDRDGVTRHEYLALRYEDSYYPSFAVEVARLYLGLPRTRMSLALGKGVWLGQVLVPTDQQARLLINYVGKERSFQYVSAADVIRQRVPAGAFRDKAVLVGTAALGTYDQKATPFSANFPSVEKNATVVENLIHGRFVQKSVWSGPLDVAMILLLGLGLGSLLPKVQAVAGAALAATAVLGYGAVVQYLFVAHGIWLDMVLPMATIASMFTLVTVPRFMTVEKQAREIRRMFTSYLSPRVVEELIRDPGKATVGGQRKELTMLFSDLVGFTSFSEQRPAEEVVAQLNEYLSAMTDVVFRWNGTLDKFVGDAIVVFWGAPLDQPNHAELAVKCALHMRKRLSELQDKWSAEGKAQLDSGIGVDTGVVVVGNVGAEGKKMDYTIVGDHVNLAARVVGLTRKFGSPIVVTEHTAGRLQELMRTEESGDNRGRLGHVALRKLGAVRVKGKNQSVVVYALESLGLQEPSREEDHAPTEVIELVEK